VNIAKIKNNTIDSIDSLITRRGGSLDFSYTPELMRFTNWAATANIPPDFIPFSIAIVDSVTRADVVSLIMMINPKDFSVTQPFGVSNTNTRYGWINTLWGNQQATISASGMTAGFYYISGDGSGGLTNFRRKNSLSFLNLLSIIAMFKNNAYYFMDGQDTPTMFKDGTSRVINVMDIIRLSYDGSDYIGNFNSFSLSDIADNPYRMEYSFEFSVSIFGSDPNSIDGHIKQNGNEDNNKVVTAIQGRNTHFDETVGMDEVELKNSFLPSKAPEKEYFLDAADPINKDYKSTVSTKMKISNIPNAYKSDILSAVDAVNKTARYKVDPNMIAGIISQESVGDQYAVSSAGAKGLMQLTDFTARDMGVTSAFDPHDNIMGGTRYFSKMLNKYQGKVDLALAAYNAGPGHVDEYHGIPPFKETQNYVPRVQNYANKFSAAHAL